MGRSSGTIKKNTHTHKHRGQSMSEACSCKGEPPLNTGDNPCLENKICLFLKKCLREGNYIRESHSEKGNKN